jgi:hypothetical protein
MDAQEILWTPTPNGCPIHDNTNAVSDKRFWYPTEATDNKGKP